MDSAAKPQQETITGDVFLSLMVPAGGVWRLRPDADQVRGAVPHGVQPPRRGRRVRPDYCCGRCLGSSRSASIWSSTRHTRWATAISGCSTSPGAGAASTPSDEGVSTSKRSSASDRNSVRHLERCQSSAREADETEGRTCSPNAPGKAATARSIHRRPVSRRASRVVVAARCPGCRRGTSELAPGDGRRASLRVSTEIGVACMGTSSSAGARRMPVFPR